MVLTDNETVILNKQIEIDSLQAKLDKKREINLADCTLDEEILYSKRLILATLLEAQT
jgi:hypothetical protein